MGEKGSKRTATAALNEQLLMEKLAGLDGITTKKMFGGYGIFHDGKMFGLIDTKGQAYFKVNDESKSSYESEGAQQHSRMPYFSVTETMMGNHELLMERANHSIKISK